ncbi:GNAT family N-acetyltransferase [Enterococcus sp. AZ058]|uniref:GNAT family N-acetyltransferase n=1 Tax=Enterococcus sp. AZ058 TaxID=2774838 RepID=UPI003D2E2FF3
MIFKSKKKNYINDIDDSEFQFYKNKYLFEEKIRDRCKEYPPFNFGVDSIILIDRLDSKNFPEIYIYKISRPIEQWMFDVSANLDYKKWAQMIGKLECGRNTGEMIKIHRLFTSEMYRNQGIATYMLKRLIEWGNNENILGFYLTAASVQQRFSNELEQEELLEFYLDFGFKPIRLGSNLLEYYYKEKT